MPSKFTAQVKGDVYTGNNRTGNDAQMSYEKCPTDKELSWIGTDQAKPFGTGKRFEGYNYFSHHPEELLNFLDKQRQAHQDYW